MKENIQATPWRQANNTNAQDSVLEKQNIKRKLTETTKCVWKEQKVG